MKRTKQARSRFPELLAVARRKAGWNQAELARRLGVGQQAVSKWERGIVAPDDATKAKIAAAFSEDVAAELMESTEPLAAAAPTTEARQASLVTRLNLGHLTGEQFQAFAADLLQAIYPSATVNIYGVSGDVQEGLDIELRFPEGYRYTAQCKRVKNFGPEKVKEAVQAHPGAAKKKYLLITRPATKQTRDAASKFAKQGWELWDIDDISRRVRYLPSDKARVLVDAYAPSQRRDFLGIDQPSPFLSPSVFFKEFLRPQVVFSHVWALVGRTAELGEVRNAVDDGAAFITIVGAGGTGKSRLVLELLNQLAASPSTPPLRVLAPAATVTPSDIEKYRDQRGVFLIEDAHDRDDLQAIVAHFRQQAPHAVLLFTTRPYGVDRLKAILARQGLDDRSRTVGLHELKRDDLEQIARQILNTRGFRTDIAPDIARLADRSPLFTVIASNLVAEKRLHPSVLSNEATFKQRVLAHFGDVLTQSLVEEPSERAKARELLNLITVLQPVELAGAQFAACLEALYKRDATEYDHVRQLLVDASVLMVRGGRARIAPDMLGDYILEQACAAPPTSGTTFPERVLAALQPGQLRNVLHNLAKLDWRLTVQEGLTPRASVQIWRAIERMYEKQSGARETILEAVEHAAYYLPAQAFEFLDNVGATSGEGRVDRVSRIIRNAAYHTQHVREAAERLWELGKNKPAQLNSHPDHPIRQLQILATIEPGKPLQHIEEILAFGLDLLEQPDAGAHTWSPFEFLQQILATEGRTHTAKGNSVEIGHFAVNVQTLTPLRKRLVHTALVLAEHPDLRVALRAIQMIGNAALRYPMRGGADSRSELDAEFAQTLKAFESLVRRGLDPLAVMEVIRAVSWHAGYSVGATHDAAHAVLAAVPTSFEQNLTECLVEGWGHHRERGTDDPTRRIESWREQQRELGREMRRRFETPDRALEVLRDRLKKFASAGVAFHGQPHIFIRLVCEDWPELARAVATSSLTDAADPIADYTEQGLGSLLFAGVPEATSIAQALLDTTDLNSKRRVAVAYGYSSRAGGRVQPDDLRMIERLCADDDEITVLQTISVLHRLSTDDPLLAKQIFFNTNIGMSEKVADELATHYCSSEQLRASFTPDEVKEFLHRVEPLAEIEAHWLQEMIGLVSASHPELALDFLLQRIARAETDSRGFEYRAIPFNWGERSKLQIRDTGYLRTAMERVLACAREAHIRKSQEKHSINELFATVVGHFDTTVRDFIGEYLVTADTSGVAAVAQLLSELPGNIVFAELEFVEQVLRAASRFGGKRKEEAEFALYRAATTGMRSGTRGKPFPQDVALKQNAEEALSRTRAGSPARKLLTWIRDHAHQQIKRAHVEAELIEEDD